MQINLVNLDATAEVKRQAEICNACRYCESYCSVFPALHRQRHFDEASLVQLANLCHNCRGCYYACQYTEPHEFDLNLPKALAELRTDSWIAFAYPSKLAGLFQRQGTLIGITLMLGFAVIFGLANWLGNLHGGQFYEVMSHSLMVAIFLPAFVLPMLTLVASLRRYWQAMGGGTIQWQDLKAATMLVANMKNLAAGHGDGCNFEDEDLFSQARRYAHQAVMYGFLLCFAATTVATAMHYLLDMPAPYAIWSVPKLLGVSGGILLSIGCIWMLKLKYQAERHLSDKSVWSGEVGFIILLGLVAVTGLLLYWLGNSHWMPSMLALHLGAVLSFFVLTPYSKMAHGFYRLIALIKEAQQLRS